MKVFTKKFHFESEDFTLVEIKRFLDGETDKSKLFYWLLFDKSTSTLKPLHFVSMDSDGENEFRVFENEHLTFNRTKAVLISDHVELFLDVIPKDVALKIQLQQAIDRFLTGLSPRDSAND